MVIRILLLLGWFQLIPHGVANTCDISSLHADHQKIFRYLQGVETSSKTSIDECTQNSSRSLDWILECNGEELKSATLEVSHDPLLKLVLSPVDFNIMWQKTNAWNWPKTDLQNIGRILLRGDGSLSIQYDSSSSHAVHLTLDKTMGANGREKFKGIEGLIFKMNLGTPTLIEKFSCL